MKNHVNLQIKTSREGSRICNWRSMVLRLYLFFNAFFQLFNNECNLEGWTV